MFRQLKRLQKAIKKYLFKDTSYFFIYCFYYFFSGYKNNCSFYNDLELIDLIKKRKSLIRIGDGEIDLIHFLPIGYQRYSDSIRNDFLKIIKNYSFNSPYVLMIPLFVNYSNKDLKNIEKLGCWLPLKVTYRMIFNKKMKYFDQHIFYKDDKFKELILPYILSKRIIIVTNENNKDGIEKSNFSSHVSDYIICPQENSYEDRFVIKDNIEKIVKNSGFSKEDFVVIMAAGLSKTIIYELSEDGYQIFDIGKGLEGYYKNISLKHLI